MNKMRNKGWQGDSKGHRKAYYKGRRKMKKDECYLDADCRSMYDVDEHWGE